MLGYLAIKSPKIERLLFVVYNSFLLFILATPLWNSFWLNRNFIQLAKALPLNSNLPAEFTPTNSMQCPSSVDAHKSILTTLGNPVYGDEFVFAEDLCTVSLDLLTEIHRVMNRDDLSDVLTAVYQTRAGNDSAAISILLNHHAYGQLLAIGTSLNNSTEVDRKIMYLEAAFTLKPNDYPIINQLVKYHLARENYCDLKRIAQIGVEYYPDSPLFYYYLGRAYEGITAWQQAGEAYQQAVDRFPNYEPYARRLAYSLQQAEIHKVINPAEVCQ